MSSKSFGTQTTLRPSTGNRKRGNIGEVNDLRADVDEAFTALETPGVGGTGQIAVDEYTNPAAADAAGLLIATASVAAIVTVTTFVAGGIAALAAYPRPVTFTTAGVTAADAPATALVTGLDVNGDALTETVTVSQIAGLATTVKCFSSLTSVVYPVADGTDATVSIGFGPTVGLLSKIKTRAGITTPFIEIVDGVILGGGGGGATTVATNNVTAAVNQPLLMSGSAVFTAPIAAESVTLAAADQIQDGVLALTGAQSDVPRKLRFVIVEGGAATTVGAAAVVGVNAAGETIGEDVSLISGGGGTVVTTLAYAQLTSVTMSGVVGGDAATTVSVGVDVALGVPVPSGALSFAVHKTVVDDVDEAVAGVDAAAMSVAPTTAANAAHTYVIYYNYTLAAVQTAHTHVQATHAHAAAGGVAGTFASAAAAGPNGSYTPATAPNGAHDYSLSYERDLS